jgi:phosphatidate cytidylyltransferase
VKQRILTAIVLFAVVMGVLFFDPSGLGKKLLLLACMGAVSWELGGLTRTSGPVSLVIGLLGLFAVSLPYQPIYGLLGLAYGVTLLITGARWNSESTSILAVPGFVASTGAAMWQLTLSTVAFPAILIAAVPIWAGDTAAIFAGKAFGNHKLAPSISPNKTWEGSVANLLAAVGAAAALGYFLKYPMDKMLLLGVSCGVIGQLGDLFESYLKRQAGVKDSGNLLPGHGGVFDRLDSLLMTAPFSYWILSSFLK